MLIQHRCHARPVHAQHALEVIVFNVRRTHEDSIRRFLVQGAEAEELGYGFAAAVLEVGVVRF